jgi:hypothetical protein
MLDARNWYLEQCWLLILERIYLIHCQLVHGYFFGGGLNRCPTKKQ